MTSAPDSADRTLGHPRASSPGIWGLLNAVYAAVVYLLFIAILAYTIGFLADRGVPVGIDGRLAGPALLAAVIDVLLLALFAVQHSVMARPWFKRRLTRIVPAPAERTTFVLCSTLALALLYWQWRPLGPAVWRLSGPAASAALAVQLAGWALVIGSTFLISHADLFGLRQAWLYARNEPYAPPAFTTRGLHRLVRHPIMSGFIVVFWAAPQMTAGHLLFAAAATGYILTGIRFEEHDLARQFGQDYRCYQASVPALLPVPHKTRLPGRGGKRPARQG